MRKYRILFRILCILINLCVVGMIAQEYNEEQYFEEIAQETNENPDLEMLEYLRVNKMNLRSVNKEDLSRIPGIDLLTADNIIGLIESNDNIAIDEICATLDLPHYVELILRETTYLNRKPKTKMIQLRSRFRDSYQQTRGMAEEIYPGPSYDLYNRLILTSDVTNGNLFGAVISKKDPGELFTESFASFHIGYFNKDFRTIIGDFSLNSGMGLLSWAPFSQNRSWDAIAPVLQRGNGFNPWRSSLQFGNFRGIAVDNRLLYLGNNTNLNFRAFFSYKNLAASYDEISGEITSLYVSGLFRTENETAKQNAVIERVSGLNVEIIKTNLTIGFNSIYMDYSKTINSESISSFKGQNGLLGSIYSFYRYYDLMLGFEAGFDAKINTGAKLGAIYKLDNIQFALHYRNYGKQFRSPFGNNFGEFYSPSNEQGLYFGNQIRASNNIVMNTYIDLFKSHTRTYSVPAIIKGTDKMLEFQYSGIQRTLITMKARHKEITTRVEDVELSKHIVQKDKYQIRADWSYKPNPRLMFRCRVEYVYLIYENKIPDESGVGCFFEFKAEPVKFLSVGARISLFDTDTYNSAIWQYESVMPGYANSPALFGQGSRGFVYLNIKPIDHLTIRARYVDYSKNFIKTMSSGYDEISGNSESRIYLNFDFNY